MVGGKARPQASPHDPVSTHGVRIIILRLPLMFYPSATIPTNFGVSFGSSALWMRPRWCPSRLRLYHRFVAPLTPLSAAGPDRLWRHGWTGVHPEGTARRSAAPRKPARINQLGASLPFSPTQAKSKKTAGSSAGHKPSMQGRCDSTIAQFRQEGRKLNRAGNDACSKFTCFRLKKDCRTMQTCKLVHAAHSTSAGI